MEYNKLVRDKVPERIKKDDKTPIIHIADNEEYWEKLKEKLQEETTEFSKEPNEEELADILEVIDAIIEHKKFNKLDIETIKQQKAQEKGKFKDKIILEKVE